MAASGHPQVLVVGAGPVGLFAALALARRGVDVRVIDRDWRTGAHSYALALHPESLRLLDPVGLGDDVLEEALPVSTIGLYDREARRAEIRLASADEPRAALAILRQDVLENHLEDTLRDLGVRVHWNHELGALTLGERSVAATVDRLEKDTVGYAVAHTEWTVAGTAEHDFPLVLGADGHRSTVRRALGIDFPQVGPAQLFAVFEFRTDADLGNQMRVVFGEATTDVLWPLPDGYCRYSFELPAESVSVPGRMKGRVGVQLGASQYPVLSEESLGRLLAERAEWFRGTVEQVRWRLVVRFERRLARAWGRGRVWLAGDAAHVTGPVGMHSMNAGLHEAAALADLFAEGARGQPPAEKLAAFAARQTERWRFLLGLEGSLQPGETTDPWVARYADRLLACLPAVTPERIAELAGQVGLGR